VTINGFSKSYAIPGWRVGYLAAEPDIIEAIDSIQSHAVSNPNTIAQLACVTALKESKKFVEKMVAEFKERRDFIVDALNNLHGVRCLKPEGAFYVFPNIQYYLGNEVGGMVPLNSESFCEAILAKARVSLVQGSAFGMEGYVRISYTQSINKLQEAIKRMDEVLEK
jgi:aspartate aminotransferase